MSVTVGASRLATPQPFFATAARRKGTCNTHRHECRCSRRNRNGVVSHARVDCAACDGSDGAEVKEIKKSPLRVTLAATVAAATFMCSTPAFADNAIGAELAVEASALEMTSETIYSELESANEQSRVKASKLPSDPTTLPSVKGLNVLDYGSVFTKSPEDLKKLNNSIEEVEASTGWRVRIVTGDGPGGFGSSMPEQNDLYKYFGTRDRKLVVLTCDEFKGNVLELYNDYSTLSPLMPKSVVQEVRGRYGNKYFVDEEGLEEAVFQAANVVTTCLGKPDGCKFVPGLSQQQREFSLVAVLTGGFLFGAASRGITQQRDTSSPWIAVFGFIWVPWVLGFGFYPLWVRQPEDLTPLYENAAIFLACVLATRAGSGVFGTDDEGDAGGPTLGGSE